MESSGTLSTHPVFCKQRMQSHHFQYFNVISQKERKKKKKFNSLYTDRLLCQQKFLSSRSAPAARTDGWWRFLLGQETRRTCYQAKRVCACVCLCVVCSVGFWCGGILFMDLCWARESSVQSQQRLGVLAFPLVFMFQRAGFHHRLGPESRKTHMLARSTHLPGVPVLPFMIFALLYFHLYGFLIIFCGKHKEFEKHSFKYKQGSDLWSQILSKYLVLAYYP